jgi:hypothetical protein
VKKDAQKRLLRIVRRYGFKGKFIDNNKGRHSKMLLIDLPDRTLRWPIPTSLDGRGLINHTKQLESELRSHQQENDNADP